MARPSESSCSASHGTVEGTACNADGKIPGTGPAADANLPTKVLSSLCQKLAG
jgi:hypothetical protein